MKTLLALTVSGSALTILLLVLRYILLKKMPSTVYYYAWLLVLLRFLLPLPGLVPPFPAAADSAPEAAAYTVQAENRPETPQPAEYPSAPPALLQGSAGNRAPEPAPALNTAVPAAAEKGAFDWRSPALWLSLWAAGAALCFGTTVFSYARFMHALRRSLRKPDAELSGLYGSLPGQKPALYCSDALKTSLMCGVLHPRIILPTGPLDAEQLSNILRHELMHFRRRDTLYKWFAAAVLSLQWFNPLAWLARREIGRACELSCDEMLLRSMNREEKQSYGNTLLHMAASSSLPAGVVATSFSTEKRNLKERLRQIMTYRKSRARVLAAVLALILLTGCGLAAGPQTEKQGTPETPAETSGKVVRVTSVDELLAAIAPDTVIELAAGEYDLSTASDYGADTHSACYSWNGVWDEEGRNSAELVITAENLTLRGEGMDRTVIAAVPRYANVIRFVGCQNLTVSNLTAGHTREPGFCSGGVLRLENGTDVRVEACGLYGCGTVGVDAYNVSGLSVSGCRIYECSYNAVSLRQCRNVDIESCEIDRHGIREGQGSCTALFNASYSDRVRMLHNRIHDNAAQYLLQLDYTENALFLSNEVHDNRFDAAVFQFEQYGATVDGCAFRNNGTVRSWVYSSGVYANDVTGKLLDAEDFEAMTLRDIDPNVDVTPAPVMVGTEVSPGASVSVKTVDEFLAAIGPDRTIVLDGELFDLSTASSYGSVGGEYYYWNQSYDGPELVIRNLANLTILGKPEDPASVTLAAIPRYANVLNFDSCENITVAGFTAGHTKEPGSCSGGVLHLQNCGTVTVDHMRLYGCGVLGIQTANCARLAVLKTEIYECSQGAGQFFQTDGIAFDSCDIHDVPSPALTFTECTDKTWNSEPITEFSGNYDIDSNYRPVSVSFESEMPEYTGSAENLPNPFADEATHSYQGDAPQALLAAAVQQAFANGDWEDLADRIRYPMQLFLDGYSTVVHDRNEFLSLTIVLTDNSPFTPRVCERIANASVSEFGNCIFGETCLDHLIAFSCIGDHVTEDNLRITAISTTTPLWPGLHINSGYVQAVPPTPEP